MATYTQEAGHSPDCYLVCIHYWIDGGQELKETAHLSLLHQGTEPETSLSVVSQVC